MRLFPTLAGLCLALGGPALLAVSDRLWGEPDGLLGRLAQQAALLAMVMGVLGIVIFGEHQTLASIGWRSLTIKSVSLGLGLAGFFIFVFSPLAMRAIHSLQLGGFEGGLATLLALPVWYRLLAVVIGGAAEEVLYRGYGIERLSWLTGNDWLSAAISTALFGCAHAPMWGWGAASTTFASGGFMDLYYLATRDLTALIIAHVMTDMTGIIIAPFFRGNDTSSQH